MKHVSLRIAPLIFLALSAFGQDHIAVTGGMTRGAGVSGGIAAVDILQPVKYDGESGLYLQTIGAFSSSANSRTYVDDTFALVEYRGLYGGPGVELGDGSHPLVKGGYAFGKYAPYVVYRGRGSKYSFGIDVLNPRSNSRFGLAVNAQYAIEPTPTPRGNANSLTVRFGPYFRRRAL